MTELINQKYKYDCGVACLAMFTGHDYNTIKNEHFNDNDFNKHVMSNVEMLTAMLNLGYKCVVEDTNVTPSKWPLIKNQPMMVVVGSRNHKNHLHMLYWDGQEVHDPTNELKKYSTRRFLKRVRQDQVFSAFYATDTGSSSDLVDLEEAEMIQPVRKKQKYREDREDRE